MLRKGLLEGERRTRRLTILLVSAITLAISALAFSGGAGAQTDSTAVTIPGNPLTVYVGPLGECQSSYLVHGEVAGNFFFGGNSVGDCGFFLAFPKAGNPTELQGKTFGFDGAAGPSLASIYKPVSQSPVTGSGTEASPFTTPTVFEVEDEAKGKDALITEVTTYVNGSPQFTSTYTVKNTTGKTLFFRAMYAA